MAAELCCLKCQALLDPPPPGELTHSVCPACGTLQDHLTFPALFSALKPGKAAERLLLEGESACFFHPLKKATVPCDHCGRFLCALCDLEFNAQHLCPSCLSTARTQGRTTALDPRRFVHDGAALTLAVAPLLIWPLTVMTAPLAVYFAVRSFRSPGSLVESGTLRALLALVIAGAEIVGWIAGLAYVLSTQV